MTGPYALVLQLRVGGSQQVVHAGHPQPADPVFERGPSLLAPGPGSCPVAQLRHGLRGQHERSAQEVARVAAAHISWLRFQAPAEDHGVDDGRSLPLCHGRYSRSVADRKSTRLNSSHVKISYAVFCLKKKKKKKKKNKKKKKKKKQ